MAQILQRFSEPVILDSSMIRYGAVLMVTGALSLLPQHSSAGLIAHYTFDDGSPSDISAAPLYDLSETGSNSFAGGSFLADGSPANYLSAVGPGGLPDFTVSLWAFTPESDQGTFKGLFSNNTSASAAFSWQIDSSNEQYVLRSSESGNFTIGSVARNTWQHIVLQKFGGSNARVFLDGSEVGTTGGNPGGLQNFRLGINRNSNNAFEGLIDNVRIYDDSSQAAAELFREGPGVNATVPAPTTLLLLGVGIAGIGWKRRRRV